MEREIRENLEKELEDIKNLWMNGEWSQQCRSQKHEMRGIYIAYVRGHLTCLSSVAERFYLDDLAEEIDRVKTELVG